MQRRRFLHHSVGMACSIAFVGKAMASSHPFHLCVGEMEWNEVDKKWEIALRLHGSDLQTAVSRLAKKRVEVDADKKEIPEVTQYLKSHFLLVNRELKSEELEREWELGKGPKELSEAQQSQLEWVGMENDRGWLWVYLELKPPTDGKNFFLVHRLLMNDVEDQTNTLLIRRGEQRQSLKFVRNKLCQAMPDWA
ncbi:MAG: DUF6702 family protein [Pirellulales bacterium]